MSQAVKPWSTHRQVLWAVGVFGMIFWVLAVLWLLFVGGFGPGSDVPRASFVDLPWLVLPSIPCVYYIVVAHRAWTRTMWYIGAGMHATMVILFLVFVIGSRGSALLLLPFLMPGPITWILHARNNGSIQL